MELLAGNLIRFVDTFTNSDSSPLSVTLPFAGDFGSDYWTVDHAITAYWRVTSDGTHWYDPVLGIIGGNNDYAPTFVATITGGAAPDDFTVATPLTLAPGESKSLMFYVFLAKELTCNDRPNDLILAVNRMNQLFLSPELNGLSTAEQALIANREHRRSRARDLCDDRIGDGCARPGSAA